MCNTDIWTFVLSDLGVSLGTDSQIDAIQRRLPPSIPTLSPFAQSFEFYCPASLPELYATFAEISSLLFM